MTYFRHKETNKYLTFSNIGTSFNNSNIVLSDCAMCETDGILKPSYHNDNTNGSNYVIKSLNNGEEKCITYSEMGANKDVAVLGQCDDIGSEFELLERTNKPLPYPEEINLLLLFDNEKNVDIADVDSVRKTILTNQAHSYSNDTNFEIFYTIKNFTIYNHSGEELTNVTHDTIYTKNVIIEGNVTLTIKEMFQDGTTPLVTIYPFVFKNKNELNNMSVADSEGALIFLDSSDIKPIDNEGKIAIKYFQRRKNRNYNRSKIGIMKDNTFVGSRIDPSSYEGGPIVTNSMNSMTLRSIPYNYFKNSEMKYNYPKRRGKDIVSISNAIYPNKKIVMRRGELKTKNKNNNSLDSLFKIEPTNNVMTSDSNFSLNPLLNSTFGQELSVLQQIINDSDKDERFLINVIEQIDKVIRSRISNGIDGRNKNSIHHNIDTIKALKTIRTLFTRAHNIYKPMTELRDGFENQIANLPIKDKFNQLNFNQLETIFSKPENSNTVLVSSNFGAISHLKAHSNNLKKLIYNIETSFSYSDEYKSIFNLFVYNKINPNIDVIEYLRDVFEYFANNRENIKKYINQFYNYLKISPKNIYDNTFMNSITTTVLQVDIDIITKLKNDIEEITTSATKQDSSDTASIIYIDIDFTIIYRDTEYILEKYIQILENQLNYIQKHNVLVEIRITLEALENMDVSKTPNSHRSIILKYIEMLEPYNHLYEGILKKFYRYILEAHSKINENDDNISVYNIFNNYYKLIKGLDCDNIDCRNVDNIIVNKIDNYYSKDYLFMKHEINIIRNFIDKCALANDEAIQKLKKSGIDFSVVSTNLKPSPSQIDGFEGMVTMSDFFPNVPTPLNKTFDDKMLNIAYKYADSNTSYDNLHDYIENKFEGVDVDDYTCSGKDINAKISYQQMNNTASDIRKNIKDFDIKPSDQCNFRRAAILIYKNETVILEIYEKGPSSWSVVESIVLHGKIDHYKDCLEFSKLSSDGNGEKDYMTKLETVANNLEEPVSSMNYLHSISEISSEMLNGPDALYSSDKKIRLVLSTQDGAKIQYIPPITLDIHDNTKSEYTIGNGNVTIYKNVINLGEHVSNSVYIDSKGKSHSVGDSYKSKVNLSYEDYENYCLDSNFVDDMNSASIGVFDSTSTDTSYNITKHNLKHVYPIGNGGCIDGDDNGIMKLAKHPFDSQYGPCATDPNGISSIKISDYHGVDAKYKSTHDFVDDSVCGLKQILDSEGGPIDEFRVIRTEFQLSFKDMINSFNELSESELNILKETDSDIDKLEKIKGEYETLYNTVNKNAEINNTLVAQSRESKLILDSTEYSMAIAGIGAVGTLLILFNYMKK